MKRTFSLFGGILACVLLLAWLFLPTAALAKPTTAAEAQKVVENWLSLSPEHLTAEMAQDISSVETFQDLSGKPLYFVVHLYPAGLVLVPGDDLVEPIIGFLPEATDFDPSPDNPLGALVSQDIPSRVMALRKSQAEARMKGQLFVTTWGMHKARNKWNHLKKATPPPIKAFGATNISDIIVAPLIQSKWSQTNVGPNFCYNSYTPKHYPCGCNATAMAQVMLYHRHPQAGVGTAPQNITVDGSPATIPLRGGDGSGGPYLWDSMPLIPDDKTPLSQLQEIGDLTRDAGSAAKSDYTSSGTGAWLSDAKAALVSTFFYGNAIYGYNGENPLPNYDFYRMTITNLQAGLPVLLDIRGTKLAHSIITDGYGFDLGTWYHHLNMGWAGLADAWYNSGYIDSNTYGGAGPATWIRACVYNIFPSGSGEIISGRVFDNSGHPLPGAQVAANGGPSVTTSAQGVFALTHLASGTQYTITVTAPPLAFAPQTVTTGTSVDNQVGVGIGNVWMTDIVPKSGIVKWGYYTNGSAYSPPALAPDGTLYMGSTDGSLYAVNSDGSLKWKYPTGGGSSSPAIGADGTIYVCGDYDLQAVNTSGSRKWEFIYAGGQCSPAIAGDGTIYVDGQGNGFYAVNPDGSMKWHWNPCTAGVPPAINYCYLSSPPAIGADGTIFVGLVYGNWSVKGNQYSICAFNPNGTQKWQVPAAAYMTAPAIGWDGTIYVGVGNFIVALNPGDGSVKWSVNAASGSLIGSPAIGADRTVYVGSANHCLYALDPVNGATKWFYDAGDIICNGNGWRTPAIGADGVIYLSAWNGVHAVNSNGTLQWHNSDCWSDSSPVIGPDGTLYVGVGYSLVAFKSTSMGLANSAWPMFHHDVKHTGLLSGTLPPPPRPPVASFTATPAHGHVPLTVQFQDKSTGAYTSRSWDFGDGTGGAFPANSPSPSHTYRSPGNYPAKLTVTGPGGPSSKTITIRVSAPSRPKAAFAPNPATGKAPLVVYFINLSSGLINTYAWDFGDPPSGASNTSTDPSPSHTYFNPGKYIVKLTVTGPGGSISKTIHVQVTP
jgi:PKD repeat protein